MADSTSENYPISDDATRDFFTSDGDDDSLDIIEPSDQPAGLNIPERIGDYLIKGLIGSGGMGQVFLAEHVRMQRAVAIKMLRSDRMQDQASIDRFYEEVRAVSRLMHPNIVAAFDAGEFQGIHYLAMEYVDGITLTKMVAKQGPMPLGEAASVIRQAAMGLLHAHRAGIVHRDVKPGNIMRANDGTIKVLDMGLAQIGETLLASGALAAGQKTDRAEMKGRLVGTLAYMSPEQLESPESVDARSDIYSLGAVLFFLLTARPPYVGEYLDQVYGHRHGEIPNLLQVRDDTDLNFANIFRRMMAKSRDQRYASLDEVIDDLAPYSDLSSAPMWLAEFSKRQMQVDASTVTGGSTSAKLSGVIAIDVGMSHACVAEANARGEVKLLHAGDEDHATFRAAIASDAGQLFFDQQALKIRMQSPKKCLHCLPMYIGKDLVEREVCGRKCPPEVLLALLMRRALRNACGQKSLPEAVALTVPASYDQLHRKSFLQAARMAGLKSVRLVDRSVAAVQSTLIDHAFDPIDKQDFQLQGADEDTILFIGLTGQACEIAVLKNVSGQLEQRGTAGHWHTGSLSWLSRLVDLASETFMQQYRFDPRKSLQTASHLQSACERAINAMLLLPTVRITVEHKNQKRTVEIKRSEWLQRANDLTAMIERAISTALDQAGIKREHVDRCVTLGRLLRMGDLRTRLIQGFPRDMEIVNLERTSVARGSAACLAAELPGRSGLISPPRCITSQSIGIVVEDARGRRRILPIIPRGTAIPARTNRRLTVGKNRDSMTLSLVESSGVEGNEWQSLGRYDFEIGDESNPLSRTRMIGFEINVNGMLTVRAQTPGQHGSETLASLPAPVLNDNQIPEWIEWIDSVD